MPEQRQEPEGLSRTLEDEVWYEHAKTLQQSPSQTIRPVQGTPDSHDRRALDALSHATAARGTDLSGAIELGETLGEGGMGIVHVGTQVALGRPVAVKTLKYGIKGEAATLKVLREAWITGSLEHPNVVPVYDVGVDVDGRPLIILKKIEGTEWSELMRDAATVARAFGVHDLLEWNLDILIAVCNAVRFAHSRSILHRDLKPENVMIGEFGEVYVVDWGIAVSTNDDGSGRLPLAADATEMAGTPHYMAPEMLGGASSRLSDRTDVYLLGSILYEIVAGAPPHQGANLMAVVSSVASSKPDLPSGAPEELLTIIARAMAREPEERFETVDAFRLAIVAFLEHRGSLALTRDADERREHLMGYVAAAEVGDEHARDRIYNLFSECRFGYHGALDAWRENESARDGLRAATETMIGYELAHDDPRAAGALAAQLGEVPEDLKALIDEAAKDKAARELSDRAFADLGRAEDRAPGRRTRVFLSLVIGTIWAAVPVIRSLSDTEDTWAITFGAPSVMVAILITVGVWARDSLTKTAFSRRVSGTVLIAFVMEIPMHLSHYLIGLEPAESQAQVLLLWATVLGLGVFAVDKRLFLGALSSTVAYLLASWDLSWRWPLMGTNTLVMLANVLWVWSVQRGDYAAFEGHVKSRLSRLTDRPPAPGSDP